MTQNMELEKFCQRYQATVAPTGRCYRRAQLSPWKMSDYHNTPISEEQFFNFTDIPMISITLPEDRFRALLEHDNWLNNAGSSTPNHLRGHDTIRAMQVAKDHAEESVLRQENPALKKAWENYQMLLRLVK